MKSLFDNIKLCECGCGEPVRSNCRFVNGGHARRGTHNTPEHNAAISQANSGDGNPAHRPEVAAKISEVLTGRKLSKKHCENIKKGNLGKKMRPESVQKSVRGRKETARKRGYYHTKEFRDGLRETQTGRKLPEEWCKAISEGLKRHFSIEENRIKRADQISQRVQQGNYQFKTGYVYLQNLGRRFFYRSSYEKDGLLLLDSKPGIVDILVEKIRIFYYHEDNKEKHIYMPDWLVVLEDGSKVLIEVKPSECFNSDSWLRDEHIWEKFLAAIDWCETNEAVFCVWTENTLYNSSSTTMSLQEIVEATVAYPQGRRYSLNSVEMQRKEQK